MSDKLFIKKLCNNKLDCLKDINFCVIIFKDANLEFFLHGLIFADEFKYLF